MPSSSQSLLPTYLSEHCLWTIIYVAGIVLGVVQFLRATGPTERASWKWGLIVWILVGGAITGYFLYDTNESLIIVTPGPAQIKK